jgi:hypothetical protein
MDIWETATITRPTFVVGHAGLGAAMATRRTAAFAQIPSPRCLKVMAGFTATGESPQEFAYLIKAETERPGPIVKAPGFAPED